MNDNNFVSDINAVRPTSRTPHKVIAFFTSALRTAVGGDRFINLTNEMHHELMLLQKKMGRNISLLDYGCGNMAVAEKLYDMGGIDRLLCMDTYDGPSGCDSDEKWGKFQKNTGLRIDVPDNSFDVAMTVDVLHHIGVDDAATALQELGRCATFIIVKDHLEFGWVSRQILRLADWYGNYAYGVEVPKKYFSEKSWKATIGKAGLRQVSFKANVRIHDGLFGMIVPPKFHFIATLTAR